MSHGATGRLTLLVRVADRFKAPDSAVNVPDEVGVPPRTEGLEFGDTNLEDEVLGRSGDGDDGDLVINLVSGVESKPEESGWGGAPGSGSASIYDPNEERISKLASTTEEREAASFALALCKEAVSDEKVKAWMENYMNLRSIVGHQNCKMEVAAALAKHDGNVSLATDEFFKFD